MTGLGKLAGFSLNDYRTYLAQTIDVFTPISFAAAAAAISEAERIEGRVLLRHDIDFSPRRSVALATLEHEMGVRASYFLLLTSFTYNALDSEVRDQLHIIRDLGHEIGLHYDASLGPDEPDVGVRRLAALMSDHLQLEAAAVSFHNPRPADLQDGGPTVGGLVNAYSGELFDAFTYVSDSNGYWRFDPWPKVVEARPANLQVLTHPEWWLDHDDFPGRRWYHGVKAEAERKWERYDADLRRFSRENFLGLPAECVRFLQQECPGGRAVLLHWLSGDADLAYLLLWQTQMRMSSSAENAARSAAEPTDFPAYARLRDHAQQVLDGRAATGAGELRDLIELVRAGVAGRA